jgi:hypothetical protein
MKPAASLSGSLLVRKGAAAPSGMALRATQTAPTGWDHSSEPARTPDTPWRKPSKSAVAGRAPLRGVAASEPAPNGAAPRSSATPPVAKTVRTTLPASCGPRAEGPAERRADARGSRSGGGSGGGTAGGASAGGASKSAPQRGHNGHSRRKLSLRLDPDRYLRLKLVSAHTQRSAQQILTDLLDRYLDEASDAVRGGCCQCLGDAADAEAPSIDMRSSAIGRQRHASRSRS